MSQQINLFTPIFRKRKFAFTSSTAILYGVGIAFVGSAVIGIYQNDELRKVQRQATAVDQALQEATALQQQLAAEIKTKKPDTRLEAEVAALNAQVRSREDIVDVIKAGAVGSTTGFSEYMRALARQSVPGLWLTGFDIALSGNALAIQGRALRAELVATYLTQLNQEKVLQGRRFAALRISQPQAERSEQAAAAQKANPQNSTAAPQSLRYLDFNISTVESADTSGQASRAVPVPPPLLGAIDDAGQAGTSKGAPAPGGTP